MRLEALDCAAIHSALVGAGCWIYGRPLQATGFAMLALATSALLARIWRGLVRPPRG